MNHEVETLPKQAKYLGYSGLLPPLFIVLYAAQGAENLWVGQAAGFGYAALIFSFLGGTWWGVGLKGAQPPDWLFAVAVLPSLIAFATYLPWIWGLDWPVPSLFILGVGLLLSPLIDRALASHIEMPAHWLRLRLHLSVGLGLFTLALCFL